MSTTNLASLRASEGQESSQNPDSQKECGSRERGSPLRDHLCKVGAAQWLHGMLARAGCGEQARIIALALFASHLFNLRQLMINMVLAKLYNFSKSTGLQARRGLLGLKLGM